MEIEKALRKYVGDNLLYTDEGFEFDDDSSFIGEGLIDSVGIMELVAYVQSQFHVAVLQSEVIPDNFDSVNKLATFIRTKQRAPLGAAPSESSTRPAGLLR